MQTLEERLKEQKGRHEGGNKWIGTGGTSPFGHDGYNPEGVRIGGQGGQKSAVKVWERRDYRNLDDTVELGTRNIKIALRKLRRFAREGAADEFDLGGTIDATARNAGLLDLKFVPERHNAREGAAVPRRRRLDGRATSASARSCSRRRAASSSTSNTSTSTTSCTSRCGRTTAVGIPSARRTRRCCGPTRPTTG